MHDDNVRGIKGGNDDDKMIYNCNNSIYKIYYFKISSFKSNHNYFS